MPACLDHLGGIPRFLPGPCPLPRSLRLPSRRGQGNLPLHRRLEFYNPSRNITMGGIGFKVLQHAQRGSLLVSHLKEIQFLLPLKLRPADFEELLHGGRVLWTPQPFFGLFQISVMVPS